MVAPDLPILRHISLSDIARLDALPTLKIHSDYDVEAWKDTHGYRDYALFLRRLNESVVGHFLPWVSPHHSQAITNLLRLLDTLGTWITEIPPLSTPQRFGNLAFRTWGKRLEERADDLLSSLLPPEFSPAIPHLKPYFLSSFGSFTRMDYGTGHETSFALFLLSLSLIRFLNSDAEEECDIVLSVFVRYLKLCWQLQDVYKLEPAGSHGVWGLDDYSFLGYIFGSGQLREQKEIAVADILHTPLPPYNLYFMLIMRIREVKHGPFHEHSSQLHSIAIGVPNWAKVNSGLFKMYEAEVLGKRVVVQHIPLGGLLPWNDMPGIHRSLAATPTFTSPPAITAGAPAPWSAVSATRLIDTRPGFNSNSALLPTRAQRGNYGGSAIDHVRTGRWATTDAVRSREQMPPPDTE